MSSVKKNVLFSSILTTANYIFPLLTFPYVSRVLGVANIGLCNFVDSIINIFILLSMMGTTVLGIREIAIVKNDRQNRSDVFFSILMLNIVASIIALISLIILAIFYEPLRVHTNLIIVGAVKLCFNLFLVEWFFKGLEDFKYITLRSIIVRCLYVVCVFVFVKSREDYAIYYTLTSVTVVFNAIINLTYASRFITFKASIRRSKSFIKPFITLGFYSLLTSAYTTLNVTFLGLVAGDTEVGYCTYCRRRN
jgi:O-antigen/teichoic acid export membrane protein